MAGYRSTPNYLNMKNYFLATLIIFLIPNLLFAQYSDWKAEQFDKPVKEEILSTYTINKAKRKSTIGSLITKRINNYSNKGFISKRETIDFEKNDSSVTNYYYAIDKMFFTKKSIYTSKWKVWQRTYKITENWTPNGAPKTLYKSFYSRIGLIDKGAGIDTTEFIYENNKIIESKYSTYKKITTKKFKYNQSGFLENKQWTQFTKKTNDTLTSKTIYHYNAEQSNYWTSRSYEQDGISYITEREFIYYQEEETKEPSNTPQYSLFNIKTPNESIPDMIYKEYQHNDDYFKTYWNIMITISCLRDFKENYKYLAQDNIPLRTYKLLKKQEAYYAMIFYGDLVLAMSEKLKKETENSENTILYWELLGSLIKNEGFVNINQTDSALFYAENILELSRQYNSKVGETHELLNCNYEFVLNYLGSLYKSGDEDFSLKMLNGMSSKISIDKCNYEKDAMLLGEITEQVGAFDLANKTYTQLKEFIEKEYGKESDQYKEVVMKLIAVKKKLVNQ